MNFNKVKYRALRLQAQKFVISNGQLYWKDLLGILLLFLVEEEIHKVIDEFHNCVCGGNYSWRDTTHNILKEALYWPKLSSEDHAYVRSCGKCQIFAKKQKSAPIPLVPIFVEDPFRQWGLDFIGEIHPPSNGQHKWILTATDYFTKWLEAIPSRNPTDVVVIKFMEENILTGFRFPRKIISDNVEVFKSSKFLSLYQNYNILVGHSTTYYLQGNVLAKSSNKTLVRILKKPIS